MMRFYIFTLLLACFTLSGCLPTVFTGATVSAVELAKDRPASEALTDVRIAAGIKAAFIKKNFTELYTKIKVEVVEGRVLYTGLIEKEEDAIEAVKIAWDQKDVKEVINELKVDQKSKNFDLVQYTRDSFITSQIKSKTFFDRSIKFVNYSIITLNDVVYLFGMARSKDELEKVANIASNVNGVKKVVSHVRIMDNPPASRPYSENKKQNDDDNESLLVDDEDTQYDY